MLKLTLIFSILLFSIITAHANGVMHNKIRLEFHKIVKPYLIKKGYCTNSNECAKRELLLSRRTKNGIHIESYSIRDRVVVSELTDKLYELYNQYNKEFEMRYDAYYEDHKSLVNKIFAKRTMIYSVTFPPLSKSHNNALVKDAAR